MKKLSVSVLALMSLSACSSSPEKSMVETGASGAVAKSLSVGSYQLPRFAEKTLPNGLRLLFVPDEKLPYISFSMMVAAGAARDSEDQQGTAAFVAELLDKGTVRRSATAIASDLGDLGAEFEASTDYDDTQIQLSGLAIHREQLLRNLVEVVTQPAFSDVEIERLRQQTLAGIERRRDKPDSFASRTFESYLFGHHPYGHAAEGTKASIQALRKKQVIRFFLANYRPNNSMLAVVGQFTPSFQAEVEKALSAWQKHDVAPMNWPPLLTEKGRHIRVVNKSDLVQSQIRIGHYGIRRANEDFLAIRVANTVLGGAFASRLNSRVRKELGLTYSTSSHFDSRIDTGSFEIDTFTKTETTGRTVSECVSVLSRFHDEGITAEELSAAKSYLKGIFPTAIETPEKLANNLLALRLYGIPDSYLTNYLTSIDGLTLSEVNRVIKKYFTADDLKIVVYGNAAAVTPQLKSQTGIHDVEVKEAAEL